MVTTLMWWEGGGGGAGTITVGWWVGAGGGRSCETEALSLSPKVQGASPSPREVAEGVGCPPKPSPSAHSFETASANHSQEASQFGLPYFKQQRKGSLKRGSQTSKNLWPLPCLAPSSTPTSNAVVVRNTEFGFRQPGFKLFSLSVPHFPDQ